MDVIEKYITKYKISDLTSNYIREQYQLSLKYGKNSIVAYMVGKFYEFYEVDYDGLHIGRAREIAQLLDIQMTKRKDSKESRCPFGHVVYVESVVVSEPAVRLIVDPQRHKQGRGIDRPHHEISRAARAGEKFDVEDGAGEHGREFGIRNGELLSVAASFTTLAPGGSPAVEGIAPRNFSLIAIPSK